MDGRQLFGVIVRSVGLLITIWGLYSVLLAVVGLMLGGLPAHLFGVLRIVLPLVYVLVGLVIMTRADGVVVFAYGTGGSKPSTGPKSN
jgi:hypothetical protein